MNSEIAVKVKEIGKILSTPSLNALMDWNAKHIIYYHSHLPIVVKDGEGTLIHDVKGKEYLDFLGQAMAIHVGYGNKKVFESVKEQLEEFGSITAIASNIPQIKLARLLSTLAPKGLAKSYFTSTGSEAVELAFKTVRRFTGKGKIICRWGDYHGWTMGALGSSGVALFKRSYDPVVPNFIHVSSPYCYRCDYGESYPECNLACARIIENAAIYEYPETIAAVIVEPIVGAGGAVVPPDKYLPEVRRICDKHNFPLIVDEVITGFGRTGKMFCCEHYGISPDIMTLGKGITSAYAPCAGIMARDKIAESVKDYSAGEHFATYENHPLSCAVALANIKVIIEDGLVENAEKVGRYFLKALKDETEKSSILGEARGKGLLLGVEIVRDKKTKEPDINLAQKIVNESLKKGLICGFSRLRMKNATIITFGPPLIVGEEEVDQALNIFTEAVKKTEKSTLTFTQ
ncbi:MAG: aspartate aminotransferase family protein [Candidatus Bathyarchaeota archaeon]